jgi:hypothetical protein
MNKLSKKLQINNSQNNQYKFEKTIINRREFIKNTILSIM